ncbi:unnamed protein product [Prunus armeniaca]
MFPEDYSIKHERLIRLRVAEGFATPKGRKTKEEEEVEDGCLNELIGRNLVDVNSTEIDGQVTKLPKEIYELRNMRHLLVSRSCDQDDDGPTQGVGVVSSGNIGALPELQKLSLIKISLKRDPDANPLEALQALPNLIELNLVDYYTGEKLEVQVETFQKLKILRIQQLDQLNLMIVENGAMPVLKKLTMSKCENLRLLPVGIEGLTKLEELCVHDMHAEFMAQLRRETEAFQEFSF